jgi:hypothetical protein
LFNGIWDLSDLWGLGIGDWGLGIGNPFVYSFDLNKDGFINRQESKVAFRNIIISIARDVAFKGLKYQPKASKFSKHISLSVNLTAKRYTEFKQMVDKVFDKADENKNGLLSTQDFLKAFKVKSSRGIKQILENVNPGGEDKMTKKQVFEAYGLVILKANEESQEGHGFKVKGAQPQKK